jgi:DNA-binding response OmpR family regulator
VRERRRVLVVDDDADIRALVAELLAEELGTPVLQASTADAALALIVRERPRLVLLDLSLPPLDGVACVRRVRAELADRPAAIVALSASPERRAEALAAGCDAFLAKPFQIDDLLAIVRAWVPRRE